MNGQEFINLLVYSDSLAFRRSGQSHDIRFTYPFLLKEMIESRNGVHVNLLLRGGGGLNIRQIKDIVVRDTGYFGGTASEKNIAILQLGIVDCAPRPVTYLIAPFLRCIPYVGPRLLAFLIKYRPRLQAWFSYAETSTWVFRHEYVNMLRTCKAVMITSIAVGLPLPPHFMEARSPGFRQSAHKYNKIIKSVLPESYCDIESGISEENRMDFLLADGHHLTEQGHRYYADCLYEQVSKVL